MASSKDSNWNSFDDDSALLFNLDDGVENSTFKQFFYRIIDRQIGRIEYF